MIKHPALRVRSIADVDRDFLESLSSELAAIFKDTFLENAITDYQITGSYARGCAELHSDLDINLATTSEKAREDARAGARSIATTHRKLVAGISQLQESLGIRFDISLEHWDVKATPKSFYSLAQMKFHRGDARRLDVNRDGSVNYRAVATPRKTPKFGQLIFDEELGEWVEFDPQSNDPWLAELDYWRRKYGRLFLEFGDTAETSHFRRR